MEGKEEEFTFIQIDTPTHEIDTPTLRDHILSLPNQGILRGMFIIVLINALMMIPMEVEGILTTMSLIIMVITIEGVLEKGEGKNGEIDRMGIAIETAEIGKIVIATAITAMAREEKGKGKGRAKGDEITKEVIGIGIVTVIIASTPTGNGALDESVSPTHEGTLVEEMMKDQEITTGEKTREDESQKESDIAREIRDRESDAIATGGIDLIEAVASEL